MLGLLASLSADLCAQTNVGETQFELLVPEGNAPYPVVALVPGCSGFGNHRFKSGYDWYVDQLQQRGFAVVRIDYLESRGVTEVCSEAGAGTWERRISDDLDRAGNYLIADSRIDSRRILVVGWSLGGGGVLEHLSTKRNGRVAFSRAVVFYPTCQAVRSLNPRIPTLLMLGELDNIQPPSFCDSLVSALETSALISVRRFERSHHGFDFIDLPVKTEAAEQATVASNPSAAEAARIAFFEFLGRSER